jgi:hypothetical protein
MNGVYEVLYPLGWGDALKDVGEDALGQASQYGDPLSQALSEIELAAHRTLGDLSHFGSLTGDVGK